MPLVPANSEDTCSSYAFIDIIVSGSVEELEKQNYTSEMLATRDMVDIDGSYVFDVTPLLISVAKGHVEMLNHLISLGASWSEKSNDGTTAVMFACKYKRANMLQLAIASKQVDLNAKNEKGETAIDFCIAGNAIECLGILLSAAVDLDVNAKNDSGFSPIISCAVYDKPDMLQVFLSNPSVNVNVTDNSNKTAAHWATENGNELCLKYLIDAKADLNVPIDVDKSTTVLAAARYEREACLKLLLAANVNVNAVDSYGTTALMNAAQRNLECTKLLLQAKCPLDATNQWKETALMLSITNEKDADRAKELIAAGANVNLQNDRGMTAAMLATKYQNLAILQALHAAKADFSLVNDNGANALMLAATMADMDALQYLITVCDLKSVNEKNETALFYAVKCNNVKAIKLLVAAGIDVNHEGAYAYTAAMMACNENVPDCLQVLIDSKANLGANSQGETPASVAQKYNSAKCLALLQQ